MFRFILIFGITIGIYSQSKAVDATLQARPISSTDGFQSLNVLDLCRCEKSDQSDMPSCYRSLENGTCFQVPLLKTSNPKRPFVVRYFETKKGEAQSIIECTTADAQGKPANFQAATPFKRLICLRLNHKICEKLNSLSAIQTQFAVKDLGGSQERKPNTQSAIKLSEELKKALVLNDSAGKAAANKILTEQMSLLKKTKNLDTEFEFVWLENEIASVTTLDSERHDLEVSARRAIEYCYKAKGMWTEPPVSRPMDSKPAVGGRR